MRSHSAFTFLELLVAVAIVGIVAGMLLPVLASAREKARESACISNLGQVDMAIIQYVQDNDEQLPKVADAFDHNCDAPVWTSVGVDVTNLASLPDVLKPYLGSNSSILCCPDAHPVTDDDNGVGCSVGMSDYSKYSSFILNTSVFLSNSSSYPNVDWLRCRFHSNQVDYSKRRYVVLFASGGVKNISREELEALPR